MNQQSIKSKATSGIIWSAFDRFAVQGGQFIIGVILARLLMPSDFGVIGMMSIFIALSQTIVDSGMGTGLIQKQNRSDKDFSTVFIFNLATSIILYFILFFSAPFIAEYFGVPELLILTRVISLTIIISAFTIVQRTQLTIKLDFKSIAKVNAISIILSGIISIFLAYYGCGVWALVVQIILRALFSSLVLFYISHWQPINSFSNESFRSLFGFGSKLLAAGLVSTAFKEIYNIVIGKVYSSTQLGYYNRAYNFADLSSGAVTSILHQVTFPILSSLQNEVIRMISVYRRIIKMTAFFIFPTMTMIALLAEPIVMILLTEKWAPVIVLLQLLSFARFFYPLSIINMNLLNAAGRSDLYLWVDLSKIPLVIVTLIITIPLGVKSIAIGMVIVSCISFFINAYMPGKLFGYGGIKQLKDLLPFFLATIIMAGFVYFGILFVTDNFLKLLIGIILGVTSYFGTAYFMKLDEVYEVLSILKKVIGKND